jgi:hypothetical protein
MASAAASTNGAAAKAKETSTFDAPGAMQMLLYSLYFVAIFQGFYYAVTMAYGKWGCPFPSGE